MTETQNEIRVARNHKDRLFRMIFREKKELLSLYNAVNGTSYTNAEDLEIVTLENAIYMNMKNDLAFIMDSYLNLYEHQSTYSPNMPLRDLFYIAKELQGQIDHRDPCIFTKLQRLILRTVVDNDVIKIRRIFFDIRNCI